MKTAALLLAFLASSAQALDLAPDAVGVHLVSVHSTSRSSRGETWNGVNPGIYLRWRVADASYGLVAGGYYNSVRQTSFYLAGTYPLTSWADVVAGAVTGYHQPAATYYAAFPQLGLVGTHTVPEKGYRVSPLLALSLHWDVAERTELRLNLMPGIYGSATAVNLAVEYRFR